jgi:hypothetical protein
VKDYFTERIVNGLPAPMDVEWHVRDIEKDFKMLHSMMMSHNGMIDGDGKMLDSGVTDLSSTFRNFARD